MTLHERVQNIERTTHSSEVLELADVINDLINLERFDHLECKRLSNEGLTMEEANEWNTLKGKTDAKSS